jgi:hypothetical protein
MSERKSLSNFAGAIVASALDGAFFALVIAFVDFAMLVNLLERGLDANFDRLPGSFLAKIDAAAQLASGGIIEFRRRQKGEVFGSESEGVARSVKGRSLRLR